MSGALPDPRDASERLVDGSMPNPMTDGFYKMPPGKLANACTYLEMMSPPPAIELRPRPAGVRLEGLTGKDASRYRTLFRTIGEPWLWGGHLKMSVEQIASMLDETRRETFASANSGGDIGLLQLEYDEKGDAEIVYFGLVAAAVGNGIGRWLMTQAIERAFTRPIKRLWLHTCNFDHPKALRFYQAAGFRIYATGFEIMDDPRALGLLPKTAAPHVPMAP